MIESYDDAKEELKRIDHLIYVTLKYTRTVDVLFSVVERMVGCYELLVSALAKKAVIDKLIDEEPDNPITKAHEVSRIYANKMIKLNVDRYLLFRKLRRLEHDKLNEFRRHVTMIVEIDGKEIKIDIDNITENFHDLKKMMEFVEKTIK
ncbi:MAG: hypothetical protein NDI94_02255 [Candidatus Woesearchaeota archaeon]|nr:hypothetical protein [Candidatus Woesearchaeota archaeon]